MDVVALCSNDHLSSDELLHGVNILQPKNIIKPDVAVSPEAPTQGMQFIATFHDNLSNNICCIVSALLAVIITILILVKWKKHDGDAEEKKEGEHDERSKGERPVRNNVGASDDEKNDSSEGQEASEEDLPWLLQKAPSEISSMDEKKRWADEKHSECSGSDKSQESVRMMQTGTGCGDSHVSKSIKIITADDDYVYVED